MLLALNRTRVLHQTGVPAVGFRWGLQPSMHPQEATSVRSSTSELKADTWILRNH